MRVSILSFTPLYRDARVLRQVEYLSQRHTVTAIGFGELNHPRAQMITLSTGGGTVWQKLRHRVRTGQLLRLPIRIRSFVYFGLGRLWPTFAYENWYWGQAVFQQALDAVVASQPDLTHANDWNALPVAARAAERSGARFVLDLHEYAPLEMDHRPLWKVLNRPMIDYFLRRYALRATAHVTVNQFIADTYAREYGFQPVVVMNAPTQARDLPFRPTDPECINLIHHGGASAERRPELMIATMAQSDHRYRLKFMLVDADPDYLAQLRALGERLAPGRVEFLPAIPTMQVVPRIAEFDMGFYLLPRNNFNNVAALPNKFFDFVSAGLAVCIGPSPEMARLTEQYGFGVVAPSFEPAAVAQVLNRLTTEDIDRMKHKAIAARAVFNADVEMGKLTALYERLESGA